MEENKKNELKCYKTEQLSPSSYSHNAMLIMASP